MEYRVMGAGKRRVSMAFPYKDNFCVIEDLSGWIIPNTFVLIIRSDVEVRNMNRI